MSHFSISEYFKLLDNGQRQCLHCENKTYKTTDDEVLRNHILTKHPAIINTPPVPPSRPQLDSQLDLMEVSNSPISGKGKEKDLSLFNATQPMIDFDPQSQVGSPTADSSGDPQVGTSSSAVRQPTLPMPVPSELPTLKQFLEDNGLGKYYKNFIEEQCDDSHVSRLLSYNDDELQVFASIGKLSRPDFVEFKKGVRLLKESHNLQAQVAAQLFPEEQGSKRKFEEDMLDRMNGLTEQEIREEKKTTVSISRITQNHFTTLLDEHGLRIKTVEFNVTPTTKPIQPFIWGDKKEDTHAQGYLRWLDSNINLPPNVKFYIASSDVTLLNTTLASRQINIKGTLDLAIVDSKNVKSGNIAGGIRVGIETKKTVKKADAMQVITELITANIFSEYPVVMLLTNLKEHWQFFWLERGCVVDCVFDLKESITLLETIVQQPLPPVGQLTPDAPYLRRCDFKTAISQAMESDGALPEDTEVEGLERLLRRPKVDIMGLLPEDDVADMRDVFDVMTPNEIREWQMRRVLDFAMQTPAVQSSMSNEDWHSIYA